MLKKLTKKESAEYGVTTNHELMESGELRFRLVSGDGSSYARIVSPNVGVWQNSHFHSTLTETYIVQKGWIVFVEYINAKAVFRKINEGGTCSSHPGVPHNVYLTANCVHHCVKHGDLTISDWNASQELDRLTKHLLENEIHYWF